MSHFTFEDIQKAEAALQPYLPETPLVQSYYLGDKAHKFFFKLESMQHTKSFKIRGALNKMLSLTEEERKIGVAAVSSGNHGISVSYGAQLLGIENAEIVVPETTPRSKIEKIEYFGGHVRPMGKNYDEAHAMGMKFIEESGLTFIDSCHNDPKIYGGQGTAMVEILRRNPDIDTVVVPIGGGGLATGTAVAAKALKPEIKVIAVQTAACPAMIHAYRDNVCYEEYPTTGETICDALVGGVGVLAYETLKDYADLLLEVSEEAIRRAVVFLLEKEKVVAEGAGAITTAAVLEHPEIFTGRNTALIFSGSNIDGTLLRQLQAEF